MHAVASPLDHGNSELAHAEGAFQSNLGINGKDKQRACNMEQVGPTFSSEYIVAPRISAFLAKVAKPEPPVLLKSASLAIASRRVVRGLRPYQAHKLN
jgi:hypothetical protein